MRWAINDWRRQDDSSCFDREFVERVDAYRLSSRLHAAVFSVVHHPLQTDVPRREKRDSGSCVANHRHVLPLVVIDRRASPASFWWRSFCVSEYIQRHPIPEWHWVHSLIVQKRRWPNPEHRRKQDRWILTRSFAKQPIENIAHSNKTPVSSAAARLSQYLVQGKQTYKNTSLANLLDFGVAFRRLDRWFGLKQWRQILASKIFLLSLECERPMLRCYMPIVVWCQNYRRSLVLSSWFSISVLLVSMLWSHDRSQYE